MGLFTRLGLKDDVRAASKAKHYTKDAEGFLRELHKEAGADRTWVLSCWDKDVPGLSVKGLWYGDFEIVKYPLNYEINNYQKMSTSILWQEWLALEEDGYNCIEDTSNYEGPLNKTIHLSRGAFSYYASAITKHGKLVGVIGCDWATPNAWGLKEASLIEWTAQRIGECRS